MKSILFSDVKNFIKYIQKRSYAIQMIILLLLSSFMIRQEYINNKILNKIDHRYFNTVKSLESIHNVDIDTKDGRIRK